MQLVKKRNGIEPFNKEKDSGIVNYNGWVEDLYRTNKPAELKSQILFDSYSKPMYDMEGGEWTMERSYHSVDDYTQFYHLLSFISPHNGLFVTEIETWSCLDFLKEQNYTITSWVGNSGQVGDLNYINYAVDQVIEHTIHSGTRLIREKEKIAYIISMTHPGNISQMSFNLKDLFLKEEALKRLRLRLTVRY